MVLGLKNLYVVTAFPSSMSFIYHHETPQYEENVDTEQELIYISMIHLLYVANFGSNRFNSFQGMERYI